MTDPNAPQQTPPPAPADAAGPGVAQAPGLVSAESPDAKTWAMIAHLLAIFFGWLPPLIIWLVKKDESPFVNQQGKEALNFELTLLIGFIVGAVTAVIVIGFLIIIAAWVLNIVFNIIATMEVNKGKPYRYPICIRFIK